MKLSKDKNIREFLFNKGVSNQMYALDSALVALDQYLEEHGFHIYPVKKEKGWSKEERQRRHIETIDKFKSKDQVIVVDNSSEYFGWVGVVTKYAPLNCMVRFAAIEEERLIPNESLDFADAAERRKGTVSFKEVDGSNKEVVLQPSDILRVVFGDINSGDVIVVYSEHLRKVLKEDLTGLMKNVKQVDDKEEKPSADGEESLYVGFFGPMGVNWKKICFPEEEKSVSYVPWMKCPVCDGWGKKFDTSPFAALLTNIVTCPCCNGDMVIPMKRESR